MVKSRSAELTQRLVDAAAQILAEQGPTGLALRKLAAAAGVSTMPVYTLFGDKQGLLTAMYREGFRRLGSALAQSPRTDDPLADLTQLGHAYRQAALDSPHLYSLMFGRTVPGFAPDETAQAAAEAAHRPLVEAVIRCQQAGVFADGEPDRVALHLWVVVHGMVNLELNGQLPAAGTEPDAYGRALLFAGMPFLNGTYQLPS